MGYLNKGDKKLLYENMSNESKSDYDYEQLVRLADKIPREQGRLLSHGPLFFTGNSACARVKAERGEWLVSFSLDRVGHIREFDFYGLPSSALIPTRNGVPLRLPFRGEWVVTSGGSDPSQNHHIHSRLLCEARALDFAIRDESGKFHRGRGDRNEDYHCYNQEVLAPADGMVCVVVDGVPDNRCGTINPLATAGNMVILVHAPHEFSAFFHLRPGTIAVRVGDRVSAGQALGRCGNSGNSYTPHLHFHMMSSLAPLEATGFPAYFSRVLVKRNGEGKALVREDYTPVAGDHLRQYEVGTRSRDAASS